jgi:hypothetical protein
MCHASFAVLFHFRRSMPEAAAGPAERRLDDAAGDRMIACLGRPHLVPAVSASQTSSTPDLKRHPPAANKSTVRANAQRHDAWRFLKRAISLDLRTATSGLLVASVRQRNIRTVGTATISR